MKPARKVLRRVAPKPKAGPVQRAVNGLVDGLVEAVNPRLGARRRFWRENGGAMASLSGAAAGRLFDGWSTRVKDANALTLHDLPAVRQRSREGALNNPVYLSIRETMTQHVVGARGIVPQSQIDYDRLGITQAQAEEFQGAADDVWREASRIADVTGRQRSWGGLLRLVYRSMFDGGDVFPSFPMRTWSDVGLRTRVNLIEAERVGEPWDRATDPRIRGGVEVDDWGAPRGFWVSRDHPGDERPQARTWRHEFWPMRRGGRLNVLQLYQQDRIGQARGVPRLASVLDMIDQVEQYVDSTLLAAEIQTRLSFWIKTMGDPDSWDLDQRLSDEDREHLYGNRYEMGVDAGSVNVLQSGDEVETVGPTNPGQYFDPFVVRLLRVVSAVTKVPYAIAFGDSGGENYSSMRRQWQSFRHTVDVEQDSLMPLCEAYYAHAIYDAWLDGRLLPGADWLRFEDAPDLWLGAVWTRPAIGSVDPTKETQSDIQAVDAHLRSPQEVIAANGGDWRTVLRQHAEFRAERERLGLSPAPAAAPVAAPAEPEPTDDELDEDLEEDIGDEDLEGDAEDELEEVEAMRSTR